MSYQDNYFAISVRLGVCQRQAHCIGNQDNVQSIADTDNEFTECQASRKKVQSIGISPVSLQVFMKTLKNDISEAYKVQADYLKIMIK